MGHQIIRQPDGKLAVFSSGTGTWVISDASPGELEDYYAQRAADLARLGTKETLAHVLAGEAGKVYSDFAMTFAEANETSREHGGAWWHTLAGGGWAEFREAKEVS